MGSEGPKLFVNKPKKGQLKLKQPQQQQQSSSSMASSSAPPTGTAAPPPQPPKESLIRRYKFVWPLLLAVNFTVGAYLFMRTKRKDGVEEGGVPSVPSTPESTTATNSTATEKPVNQPVIDLTPASVVPLKPRGPIPENEQRELFKWLLEEKRKLKPKDSAERKRIDEEKAILKQFIRAKSIPNL